MAITAQAKFRRSVKLWLLNEEKTVTDLAVIVGRRRDTVSTAINNDRFPQVREAIKKAIKP